MELNKPVFIIILVIAIAIAGFAAGSFAGAYMLGEPGSDTDPLVAQSYLQEAVEGATEELKEQIVALYDQIDLLRGQLEELEGKVNASGSLASRSAQANRPEPKTQEPAKPPVTATPEKPAAEETISERVSIKTPEPGKTGVIVPEVGANIRTGPGTDFEKVMTLNQGARVELLAEREGWHEVKLADQTKGWIAAELIQKD